MIGGLAGAAMGAVAGIAGGIVNSKRSKLMNQQLDDSQQENQAWYDRKYNEDYTQRADAQNALRLTTEQMEKMNRQSRASNIVAGGTAESLALDKQASNNLLQNTTANIVANAEQYKQGVENQYLDTNANIQNQRMSILGAQMKNAANSASAVAEAGASMGSAYDKSKLK